MIQTRSNIFFLIIINIIFFASISGCSKKEPDSNAKHTDFKNAQSASASEAAQVDSSANKFPIQQNISSQDSIDSHVLSNDLERGQLKKRFEAADEQVSHYLDQIENPKTSESKRKQILCQDYPRFYQNEYIPSLLKLSRRQTSTQLKSELEFVLNDYKVRYGITC